MRILVTGAGGFIGTTLLSRLANNAAERGVSEIVAVDRHLPAFPSSGPIVRIEGDITAGSIRDAALAKPVDRVFHLSGIMSGEAEVDYEKGRAVNLEATLTLLEALGRQQAPPRVVFSSSIAVYGRGLAAPLVDDDTPPAPGMTYGAQKLIGEILIADFSRRGWIDGRVVRLPGIVARPATPNGALSAFMSDIIRELMAGRPYTCPVSAGATAWWMSCACCIDNLLHAADLDIEAGAPRVFMLPVLHASIGDLAAAVASVSGHDVSKLLTFRPDPALEGGFGAFPGLSVPRAEAAGFRHDGDLGTLLRRAVS